MKIDATGVLRDVDGRIPPCPKCGKRWEPIFDIGPFGPHWAKCTCRACGAVWFPPKLDRDKSKRPAKQAKLVKRYSRGYCELCLIPVAKIPKCESLTAHHVDEYHAGGDESRENIWIVCTRCEKLIHHQRTYIGHLVNGVANVDREERTPVDADTPELDTLENGQAERGPAYESSDSSDGPKCEQYRPFDVDEF
jgi:hypothetical protein